MMVTNPKQSTVWTVATSTDFEIENTGPPYKKKPWELSACGKQTSENVLACHQQKSPDDVVFNFLFL